MGDVHESGYVLRDHLYHLEDKLLNREEFANILKLADAGQKPLGFDLSTRVKVDPALVGKSLWIGIFEFEFGRPAWDRDAVVVDQETRQMIEREVTRPLSRERWV